MANRIATHILKHSNVLGRPLPSSLLGGEPIVNTADGIMYFSGVTASSNGWTPAGTGGDANFFEVGSNLYDLQLRNKITKYEGINGSGLVGKFLSGTTNGFVLANIADIAGIDTFTTGFTYSNNVLTIKQNIGQPDLSITINTMTGLTVNGIFSAETANILSGLTASNATIQSLSAVTGNISSFSAETVNVASGLTASNGTIMTLSATSANINKITEYGGLTDVSGKFLSGTTSGFELANISDIIGVDTFVTGFTYTPSTNTITLSQNVGQAPKTISIDTVSGLTVSDLTANRVVYTTGSGKLITGTATFDGTDMVLPTAGSLSVGSGGVNTTGNVVIGGDLTVLGSSVSAFTSQLYVEDNNVSLNYNPTGSTIATSVGAGWTIQDGNGVVGGDVNLDVRAMNTFTGLTSTNIPDISEYSSSTGYGNRAFVTQLNDIVIRSTNMSTPNGVRVLAEFDVIDGGTY
jgi:hypothetical protein